MQLHDVQSLIALGLTRLCSPCCSAEPAPCSVFNTKSELVEWKCIALIGSLDVMASGLPRLRNEVLGRDSFTSLSYCGGVKREPCRLTPGFIVESLRNVSHNRQVPLHASKPLSH